MNFAKASQEISPVGQGCAEEKFHHTRSGYAITNPVSKNYNGTDSDGEVSGGYDKKIEKQYNTLVKK